MISSAFAMTVKLGLLHFFEMFAAAGRRAEKELGNVYS